MRFAGKADHDRGNAQELERPEHLLAVGSRMGESLLPLIVMPVVIPLMIAAVETTRLALGGGDGSTGSTQWYLLLAGFDLVVGLAAIATFSFVVEDS